MRAKENPFRAERISRLQYRTPEAGWEGILSRLRLLGYRGAFVGPEGSGKTTALHELKKRLENEGKSAEIISFGSLTAGEIGKRLLFSGRKRAEKILLIDSAELCPVFLWPILKFLLRSTGGLVITAHAAGRLPEILRFSTGPGLLDELLSDLVSQPSPAVHARAHELFKLHSGNLRLTFLALYDEVASGDLNIASSGRSDFFSRE